LPNAAKCSGANPLKKEKTVRGNKSERGACLDVLQGEAGVVLDQTLDAVVAAIGGGEMKRGSTLHQNKS
jgi:hypothetical protein